MNKQRLTKTKIFLGLFVVSIFLCNLLSDNLLQSNLRFMEDRENPLDENHIEIEKKAKGINSFETPKYSSGYPQFETALTTDNFYISPKNMDGVKDSLNISFEVDRDAYFNLSIEEGSKMIQYDSSQCRIVGNASKLYLFTLDRINNEYDDNCMRYRTSEDQGGSWSEPIEISQLSHKEGVWDRAYYDFKVIQNKSDNSFLIGYIYEYSNFYSFRMKKSDNLDDWTDVTTLYSGEDDYKKCLGDIAFSNDSSQLYALTTTYDSFGGCWFHQSDDGGETWTKQNIYSSGTYLYSPSISVSPNNTITCVWYDSNNDYYKARISDDNGTTWRDFAFSLDESRGIGELDINKALSSNFAMEYVSDNLLKAVIACNYTKIMTVYSEDNGENWNNLTLYKDFGSSSLYSLDYEILSDGNETLTYNGDMSGNILSHSSFENSHSGGSAYFVRKRKVFDLYNQSIQGNKIKHIEWDGKDKNGILCRDGPYLAKLHMKDQNTGTLNPNPSTSKFKIDDNLDDPVVSQENIYFSPTQSPGIKDSTSLTFETNEDVDYEVFIDNADGYYQSSEYKGTNDLATDFHADLAMDDNERLWCVFTSYRENDRDIFLKFSDDYGRNFGTARELVVDPSFSDDTAAIATYKDEIYIVFARLHPNEIHNTNSYDIYFMKSVDGGFTFSNPINITDSTFRAGSSAVDFVCPDILVTNNGSIIVGYTIVPWGAAGLERSWEVKKSIDSGDSWCPPITIDAYSSHMSEFCPLSLSYNQNTETIIMAGGEYPDSGEGYLSLYNSTDFGLNWDHIKSFPTSHRIIGTSLELTKEGDFELIYVTHYYEDDYRFTKKISDDNGNTWTNLPYSLKEINIISNVGSPGVYCELRGGSSPRGDIFYSYTAIEEENTDVIVIPNLLTMYHQQGIALSNIPKQISWDGMNHFQSYLSNDYNISLVITDKAGNMKFFMYNCTLDDEIPDNLEYDVDFSSLDTEFEQEISCRNLSIIDYNVDLYYRFDPNEDWNVIEALYNGSHFNAVIPSTSENDVYFYFNATDKAGNSHNLDPKYYYSPAIGYTIENRAELNSLSTWDNFSFSCDLSTGINYIDYLFIEYQNGSERCAIPLDNIYSTIYSFDPILFSNPPEEIDYEFYVNFTDGTQERLEKFHLTSPSLYDVEEYGIDLNFQSPDTARKLDDEFSIRLNGMDMKYISSAIINYKLNDGDTYNEQMRIIDGEYFVFEFNNGSKQNYLFEYEICVWDIHGNEHVLANFSANAGIQQEYIPPLPEINLSWQWKLTAVVISSITGLVVSILYTLSGKSANRKLQKYIEMKGKNEAQESNKSIKSSRKDKLNEISNKKKVNDGLLQNQKNPSYSPVSITPNHLLYYLISLGSASFIIYSFIAIYSLENGFYAMIASIIGLLLATAALVEKLSINITESLYFRKKKTSWVILAHLSLIVGALLSFINAGKMIEWFNYYVSQDVFSLGDSIEIPSLWLSMFSVFLTSVVIVVVSTNRDLKKKITKFSIMEKNGNDWKVILTTKEDDISKMKSNIFVKTLVFLLTVFFTVVSTTEIGRYSDLGLILIVPFILVMYISFKILKSRNELQKF